MCFDEEDTENFEEEGYISDCLMFEKDDIEAGDVCDEHAMLC